MGAAKEAVIAPDPEEEYDSEEDEDFNPTAVAEAEDDALSDTSDDDESTTDAPSKARKNATRKRKQAQPSLDQDLDSGDEATIRELKKKKRKTKKTNGDDDDQGEEDDDSSGEGGLIKTRAQRRAEKQEKADFRRADKGQVTVDVDSLWAKLSSAPVGRHMPEPQTDPTKPDEDSTDPAVANPKSDDEDDDGMITIKRSYGFAGETHTEQKRVHKDSAEAKLYLASKHLSKEPSGAKAPSPGGDLADGETGAQLRRPLRRASRFEPNPTGEVKGLPLERQRLRAPTRADVLAQQQRKEEEDRRKAKVQRLTTVQKSAIDWAAHVDKEGLKEELDIYGRSKQGFLGKMSFIRGVEGRKEHEERNARLASSAAAANA